MFYPDWKDWMNASKMGLNKVEPFIPQESGGFTPEMIDAAYKRYQSMLREAMSVPQSPDQIRRDWYKTLKTEELWNLHDELLDEIRGRTQ